MKFTTIAAEARHRVRCCVRQTGDGWGELRSLRNFRGSVARQIEYLQTVVDAMKTLPKCDPLYTDVTAREMVAEHAELEAVLCEIDAVLNKKQP